MAMQLPRRIRFALAQIGSKPGGKEMLARLLTANSLPGPGWRKLDERTWRTGISNEAWAQRAREAGSITAWRSFEQLGELKWVWIEAVPLVTNADVVETMSGILQRGLRNLNGEGKLTASEDVTLAAAPVPGRTWAHLQEAIGPKGESENLYFAWAVGTTHMVIACTGQRGAWTWDAIGDLARQQSERLGTPN
jgi:hypothetical protein